MALSPKQPDRQPQDQQSVRETAAAKQREPVMIKSAQRTLAILECFRQKREPMTALSVAKALDYPQSSTLQLLKTLSHLNYLTFDPGQKTYFPSLRLSLLGDWVGESLFGGKHIIDAIRQLHRDFGETTYIAVRKGLAMQYTYCLPGTHALSLTITPGMQNSLFASSVGQAILSLKTDEQISTLVQQANLHAQPPDVLTDAGAILESIKTIRRQGYASVYDTILDGVGGISVTVPAKVTGNEYAIGIGGPSGRIAAQEKVIADRMRMLLAPAGQSAGLGYADSSISEATDRGPRE